MTDTGKWCFDLFKLPEWALPRLKEVPQGRTVENMLMHAPVAAEPEVLEFGSLAE